MQLAPLPLPRPPRPTRAIPWGEVWAGLTWDLRALLLGVVVVLAAGVAWLFVPRAQAPIVPVLGVIAPAPSPAPTPTPKPPGAPKRRWLPW